jgi:hypothetical protein
VATTLTTTVRAPATGATKDWVPPVAMRPDQPMPLRLSTRRSPLRAARSMAPGPVPNQPLTSTTTCTVTLDSRQMAPPPRATIVWLARSSPARKFTVDVGGGAVPHG